MTTQRLPRLTATRVRVLWLALGLAFAAACESDGGGSPADALGGDTAGVCGTEAAPTVLTLADVTPARGGTVGNAAVVHAFTIVAPPGIFDQLAIAMAAGHSAGLPSPPTFALTIDTQAAGGHRYTAAPVTWAQAPGHVELTTTNLFRTTDDCYWVFPSPLFSYDVVPDAGGPDATGGDAAGPDAAAAL